MTFFYNLILFAVDVAALRFIVRRNNLAAWCGVILCTGAVFAVTGAVLGGVFENHFGIFRLWAYGVFLHGPVLLIGTSVLWWRTRRRLAMVALLACAAVGLIAAYAFLIEPFWLEVSHVYIASPKIHRPMRIVVVADLQTDHFGDYERTVLRRVLEEKPDIILLAGDYLQIPWERKEKLRHEFNAFLHEINFGAPGGVFAVQGNVDESDYDKIFTGLDVTTISVSRSFSLDGIDLTCLSLRDSFNTSLHLAHNASERFHLVLGHVPNFALGTIDADLLVAGHTHGGQVCLPFLGPVITHTSIPNAWAAGLTELPRGGELLVSRGIGMERGYAPRFRFNCRPELVVVDLTPKEP